MEKFRVGDIVVSSMNIGPSWEVVRVNKCSYQLRLHTYPDGKPVPDCLRDSKHNLDFDKAEEILSHKNSFLAHAKHAIQDSETFVLEKNKIIG